MNHKIQQLFDLNHKICLDCYYIVSEFMGDAEGFYYSAMDAMRRPDTVMFVATNNYGIQGFVMGRAVCIENSRIGKLEHLYVTRRAQRSGLGGRLLTEYTNWAIAQQLSRLQLLSRVTRQAFAFYEKHGFVRVGLGNAMQKTL
ncbi:MAG: GNAT family N-acetyltransferase [Alphaproteobacteria bacterium]|nr:GNAT family N-acetyltransferase [Alphaproteobacteria bacterium]